MKKAIALTLAILLLLTIASCGKREEEPAPTSTEPQWEPGVVQADYGELAGGEEVRVTTYDDETAIIWLGEDQYAQIPRYLVKLEGDESNAPWTPPQL